jgi:putative membrane-bound dehydrogenase-like protein
VRRSALRVILGIGILATTAVRGRSQDPDLARELPRIPPKDVAAALNSFRLHEGFHLEPIAVEPMVSDPVSVCYDADGRLYVAEMRDYPFPGKKPPGHITRLEDRDGDGRFESRTIFLDGLAWPTGVVPFDGGIFIASAPEILYAKDTDGNGVADIRRAVFTGFGIENVQGLMNGLIWGPDGWIYGVTSSNGGLIHNLTRPGDKAVSVHGRDFRFKPDGSAFEAISGGGQFGHAFDDWGHRFTCNNSNHARQIVLPSGDLERNPALIPPPVILDIAAEGPAAPVFRISPAEPWRVVRTRQRAADPVMSRQLPPTELVATGFFTSATGITIYRGSAYPESYRGDLFVGDVGGNLVHRKRLQIDGAAYRAVRADEGTEFLASTDNWFRPVNFANTPDGTLLILDMYRETIEHPWSIPDSIKKHLDLTSGHDRGRLYELAYSGAVRRRKPHLSGASSAELVKSLADPDSWWRETAQRLLIERCDRSAVPLLRELAARRPNALGRLHALWTLRCLDALDPELLTLGLTDAEPRVREPSVRLTEGRLKNIPALATTLLSMTDDPDPMVRFQLAFRLGEIASDPRAIAAIATIAAHDATSPWTRTAVLSSISGRSAEFLSTLASIPGFLSKPEGAVWLDQLAYMVGVERNAVQLGQMGGQLERAGLTSVTWMRTALALSRGLQRIGGSLPVLMRQEDAFSRHLEALLAEAGDLIRSDSPAEDRLVAVRFLAVADAATARQSLPDLLEARQPAAVQLGVIQALGEVLDRSAAQQLIARWRSMSPSVRREAIEVLFSRRDALLVLIDAIGRGAVPASDMDPGRLTALGRHRDPAVRTASRKILAARGVSSRTRSDVLASSRAALTQSGNRNVGREVFRKVCATCHQAEGLGVEVGPNLATVANRSPEDLLVHILDPNREVAPNYVNYSLATTSGRVLSGIIVEESAAALVLRRAEGASDIVPRDQIETLASTGISLMPEGLERELSTQNLADLIAFLRSIRPEPPTTVPKTSKGR